jgi:mannose-6-phosphate isomerase-like protein (cupin superfamily)
MQVAELRGRRLQAADSSALGLKSRAMAERFRFGARDAAALVPPPGQRSVQIFARGSIEVKYYKPIGIDKQEPHTRDEFYVVISGTGWFRSGDKREHFVPNDVLFAPAGAAHRFEEFSDDFATWVIFYGPEGGEKV